MAASASKNKTTVPINAFKGCHDDHLDSKHFSQVFRLLSNVYIYISGVYGPVKTDKEETTPLSKFGAYRDKNQSFFFL